MALSQIEEILEDTSLQDSEKVTALYNQIIKPMIAYLTNIHDIFSDEVVNLDKLMDANGNNKDEHHAKTMVFYGRKLSVRDLIQGVKSSDPSKTEPPYVDVVTGLNSIISEYDYGRIPIKWDCFNGYVQGSGVVVSLDNIWKAESKPETQYLEQKHTLGSKVTMPSIQNLDNGGIGIGTNTYKVKSGYTITGWAFKNLQFRYNDTGNDWQYSDPSDPKVKIPYDPSHPELDNRVRDISVFTFGSNAFKMPYRPSLAPGYTDPGTGALVNPNVEFVLNVMPIWFEVKFVIRHGTAAASAPCRQDIKTKLGNTIKFPLTTLITMDEGYEISTEHSPYGSWSTVDPATGASQHDPDGDIITDRYFNADSEAVVGTNDFDAGIRYLYLEIKEKAAPSSP